MTLILCKLALPIPAPGHLFTLLSLPVGKLPSAQLRSTHLVKVSPSLIILSKLHYLSYNKNTEYQAEKDLQLLCRTLSQRSSKCLSRPTLLTFPPSPGDAPARTTSVDFTPWPPIGTLTLWLILCEVVLGLAMSLVSRKVNLSLSF